MNRRGFLKSLGTVVSTVVLGVGTSLSWNKPSTKIKVGFKGFQYLEPGVIYCPYIPLFQTHYLVQNEKFVERFASMRINPDFYRKVTITT